MGSSYFEFTTADGRLTVYEAPNGYYVRDNRTGRTVDCGDGVDWFFDEEDRPLQAGSPELHRAIIADINANRDVWLEAHFGFGDE